MRVGAENRKEITALIVLAALAVVLVGRTVLNWGAWAAPPTATAGSSPAAPPFPTRRARPRPAAQIALLAPSADPRLRLDLLRSSEDRAYEGRGRDIFRDQMEEIPRPVVLPDGPQAPVQQGPPQPPPINLKFFGFASKPGEPKRIFLVQGDDVFVAGEGDIVDRRYKVMRIQPYAVEIQDVLSNNRQTIPLTQS